MSSTSINHLQEKYDQQVCSNNTPAIIVHEYPYNRGVLSILDSQEEARRCEDNTSQGAKNVHAIEDEKEKAEGAEGSEVEEPTEGVAPDEHTK